MSGQKLMTLRAASIIALGALAAAGAAAQPRRTIEPDTILKADGCREAGLGYRRLRGCRFTGMALSPTADRVLTVRDDDRAQLWTRDGRLLAGEQATAEWSYTPTGSALFVGDAAVALTGHAWLLV